MDVVELYATDEPSPGEGRPNNEDDHKAPAAVLARDRGSQEWSALGPKVREWKIQVEKTGSLGLHIEKGEKGQTTILIGRVKNEGPIKAWNDARGRDPSELVARGDRIVEVNGARGDMQEILKTLSTSTSLNITISRLMEFRVMNLPNDGPLGIEFDQKIKKNLVIKAIGEGSAHDWKLKPDCELRPLDMILEVNGEVGDASQLKDALRKTKLLTLLVKRSA